MPAVTVSPSRKPAADTRPATTAATVVATLGSMVPMKDTSCGIAFDCTGAVLTATGRGPQRCADAPWAASSTAARAQQAAMADDAMDRKVRERWGMSTSRLKVP